MATMRMQPTSNGRRTPNPWVKLARELQFAHGAEPAGAVGINVGPAKRITTAAERAAGAGLTTEIDGASEVHLVHAVGGTHLVERVIDGAAVQVEEAFRGGDTRAKVVVKNEDLVLVTDRNDVPAERLATYAPDWQPKARQTMTADAKAE